MCKKLREAERKIVLGVAGLVFRLRFNYHPELFRKEKGPYLLLCNHVTDFDPFFLTIAAGRPPRFVASDHVLRQGLITKLATRYSSMIIHRKGAGTGMRSAMEILRALRAGDPVGLFPEGNRCFNGVTCDIPAVTGKLVRSAGVPVITYRLVGGYLTQPRWGFGFRRGRMEGHLVHIYRPEELAEMTADEVLAHIREDLHEDAFASQKAHPVRFACKAPAEGLETAVFACPKCGSFSTLSSLKDTFLCSCGYRASMDAYGFLHTEDGTEQTVTELDMLQREKLTAAIEANDTATPLWQDTVTLETLGEEHTVLKKEEIAVTAYPDRLETKGQTLTVGDITGLAVTARHTLNVFLSTGAQYEITGAPSFCGLKYIYWYRIHRKETLF